VAVAPIRHVHYGAIHPEPLLSSSDAQRKGATKIEAQNDRQIRS